LHHGLEDKIPNQFHKFWDKTQDLNDGLMTGWFNIIKGPLEIFAQF